MLKQVFAGFLAGVLLVFFFPYIKMLSLAEKEPKKGEDPPA